MNYVPNKKIVDERRRCQSQENPNLCDQNIQDEDIKYAIKKSQKFISFNIRGCYLSSKAIYYMTLRPWPLLVKLILADSQGVQSNNIGVKGINYLTRMETPMLQAITIEKQDLPSSSVVHLFKARWPRIKQVHFRLNSLYGTEPVLLAKANWKNLDKLYLGWNQIGYEQMLTILTAQWPKMKEKDPYAHKCFEIRTNRLNLCCNRASDKKENKIKRLCLEKWPKLQILKYNMYAPDNEV